MTDFVKLLQRRKLPTEMIWNVSQISYFLIPAISIIMFGFKRKRKRSAEAGDSVANGKYLEDS